MRRQVSFYPPAPLHDRLLELAAGERRPVAATVLLLVEEALSARGSRPSVTSAPAPVVADAQPRDIPARTVQPSKRSVTPDPRKP